MGYEEFRDGKRLRHVWLPNRTVEPGKWPCQVDRYWQELKTVCATEGLTDAERVQAILKYVRYEPEGDEEAFGGGRGYGMLQDEAIRSLGRLKCQDAHAAVVGFLDDRRHRASAAMALEEEGNPESLPSLLKALEQEDSERRDRPFRMEDRNRDRVTARIAAAMLKIAPDRARELLSEFLQQKDRVYRDTIEGAVGPAAKK